MTISSPYDSKANATELRKVPQSRGRPWLTVGGFGKGLYGTTLFIRFYSSSTSGVQSAILTSYRDIEELVTPLRTENRAKTTYKCSTSKRASKGNVSGSKVLIFHLGKETGAFVWPEMFQVSSSSVLHSTKQKRGVANCDPSMSHFKVYYCTVQLA